MTVRASAVGYRHASEGGFTLIEIMAALAILGTTLLVLLDSHYNALQLHDETRETALMNQFVEAAIGLAEIEVLAGQLEGSGDFGERNEGYEYAYSAALAEEAQGLPLYTVTVTVTGPEEERTLMMLVYNLGLPPGGMTTL